jgi:hypothetical protein
LRTLAQAWAALSDSVRHGIDGIDPGAVAASTSLDEPVRAVACEARARSGSHGTETRMSARSLRA